MSRAKRPKPSFIFLIHNTLQFHGALMAKTHPTDEGISMFAAPKLEHRYAAAHRSHATARAHVGMTCAASLYWVLYYK